MNHDTETIKIELPTSTITKLRDIAKKRNLTIDDYIRLALRAMSRRSRYFDLDDKLTFGKYEEEILKTVISVDPTYIVWCIRNIEGFLVSDQAEGFLIDVLAEAGLEIGESLYKTKVE